MAKAKKKTVDYVQMSDDDLVRRVDDLRTEYFSAQQKGRLGQFKKTSEFPRLKREIARCKTFLRMREIQSKASAQKG